MVLRTRVCLKREGSTIKTTYATRGRPAHQATWHSRAPRSVDRGRQRLGGWFSGWLGRASGAGVEEPDTWGVCRGRLCVVGKDGAQRYKPSPLHGDPDPQRGRREIGFPPPVTEGKRKTRTSCEFKSGKSQGCDRRKGLDASQLGARRDRRQGQRARRAPGLRVSFSNSLVALSAARPK